MAVIVTENKVSDVVANAIVAELRSRGFQIGQGHVIVNAELQKFYNDFKVGFFSGGTPRPRSFSTRKSRRSTALADAVARLFSDPAFVDTLITAGKL